MERGEVVREPRELEFRVLGPTQITESGELVDPGSPKQRALLALLLLNVNEVLSTDRILDQLWAGKEPDRARRSLRVHVSNLRRVVEPESGRGSSPRVLISRENGYALMVNPERIDTIRFESLVGKAHQLLASDPRTAGAILREALGLWRGRPYEDVAYEEFSQGEIRRLEELRMSALEDRLHTDLALGRHREVIGEIEAAVADHRLRESLWSLLMLALYRSGRQADALRAYQKARTLLGEELGIEPSPELRALEERILLQDPELATPPAPSRPRTNLPRPLSTFVGRDGDVEALMARLAQSRLATITGPPGIGKTRLAIQVGSALADAYADGVFLADLAPLQDGSLLATEILGVLGLDAPFHQTPLEALCDQLAGRSLLLVLDNCEHLREESARVAVAVLRAAPQVRVLATSRAQLGVAGEVVSPLGPLTLPTGETVLQVSESEAGRLFIERASAILPTFEATEESAPVIADICRRLDGLPLAIELAASRIRSLDVLEIGRRLDDRFRLLTVGDPTALPRQQTLLATVRWSYDLLVREQQVLYRRLAAFAGGFTLKAAGAVGSAALIPEEEAVDDLDDLVAQSLVVVEQSPSGARYRMLETIRAHALELAREAGEAESARAVLLQWALELAQEAQRQMATPEELASMRKLVTEFDNVRAALRWALEHDPVTGLRVLVSLVRFFWLSPSLSERRQVPKWPSYLHEGASWLERMLQAAVDAPASLRALALAQLAGRLELRLGRVDEAEQHLNEADALARDPYDQDVASLVAYHRAWVTWGRVPISKTVGLSRRALQLRTELGDTVRTVGPKLILGYALLVEGKRPKEAIGLMRSAYEAAKQARVPDAMGHCADLLALAAALHDTDDNVPGLLSESLRIFSEIGFQACTAHVLQSAALYEAKAGDSDRVAELLGASQGIRDRLSIVTPAAEDRSSLVLDRGRDLDEQTWAEAFARGRALDFDEAVNLALAGLRERDP